MIRKIPLRKDGSPDRRFERRETNLKALAGYLKDAEHSVTECAEHLGVSHRALYFLFAALETRGHRVARLGRKVGGRYTLLR